MADDDLFQTQTRALVIIISGPSGVGKDVVLQKMKESNSGMFFAVTATTRPLRPGETDGVDYIFHTRSEFERMIENQELLEWANVYGNLYGIPRKPVDDALAAGKDVVLKVDIQGAATVQRIMPEAVSIFIAPPSFEELEWRLRSRKTEASGDLELRLGKAHEEMQFTKLFNYLVTSYRYQVPMVIARIEAIIMAEKCKVRQIKND